MEATFEIQLFPPNGGTPSAHNAPVFSAFCSSHRDPPRTDTPGPDPGLHFWLALWRGHRLRGAARRADSGSIDPHLRAFHQPAARVWASLDPGKQHRADHRELGPVDRVGGHLHPAGPDFSRLRPRVHAHFSAGVAGRTPRCPLHDSVTTAIDRGGARPARLPRRHGLRGCAAGGRARRFLRRPRLSWSRLRWALHLLPE